MGYAGICAMKTYKKKDLIEDGKSLHIFWETRTDCSEPAHTHDFIELVYVKEGVAKEWVDGQMYRVERGDLLFLNYDCTHSFLPDGKYTYVNICFSPETLGNTIITPENAFSLLTLTAFNEMRSESNGGKLSFYGGERKEIEDILDAMLKEYAEKQTSWNTVMENYLNILITKMLRQMEVGIRKEDLGEMWEKLSAYIDANLDAELTLSALAQKCFYNPSYFSRVFKEKFQMSPVEYVTRKRLDCAVRLLCESEVSVDEVGIRAGFSDRSSFYRAFSKYVGGRPSDYRKAHQKVKKDDKKVKTKDSQPF